MLRGSRYSDTVPINVAKKFAKKIFQNNKICKINFCIRETTRNSKKKLYHYIAIRKGDNIKVKSDRKKIQKGGDGDTFLNRSTLCNFMIDFVLDCAKSTDENVTLKIYDGKQIMVDDEDDIEVDTDVIKANVKETKKQNEENEEEEEYYIPGKYEKTYEKTCKYYTEELLQYETCKFYTNELPEETCKLFKVFDISYDSRGLINDTYFTLHNINLGTEAAGNYKQREALIYAIIQGLKMGMILLKTLYKNLNEIYIMRVSTKVESDHLVNYFYTYEKFRQGLSDIHMGLKLCDDNIHFYWYVYEDGTNTTLRKMGNGEYPLIIDSKVIDSKKPPFTSDSRVALLIKDHVIELILKKISYEKNISDEKKISDDDSVSFSHDILFQTVFKSYKIDIDLTSKKLTINLEFNDVFKNIVTSDDIIKSLLSRCENPTYNNVITTINDIPVKKSLLKLMRGLFS